ASLTATLWRKASELGWPGMLVPAEYGGSESTLTDAAVLFEELGRGPVPGPFFSSGVLGALTILEAGSGAQRRGARACARRVLRLGRPRRADDPRGGQRGAAQGDPARRGPRRGGTGGGH